MPGWEGRAGGGDVGQKQAHSEAQRGGQARNLTSQGTAPQVEEMGAQARDKDELSMQGSQGKEEVSRR